MLCWSWFPCSSLAIATSLLTFTQLHHLKKSTCGKSTFSVNAGFKLPDRLSVTKEMKFLVCRSVINKNMVSYFSITYVKGSMDGGSEPSLCRMFLRF